MSKEHFLEQHDPERKDFQIDRIIFLVTLFLQLP